jgi:hypothetical protein
MEFTHTSLSEAMTHDRNQFLVERHLRNRLHCSSNRLLVNPHPHIHNWSDAINDEVRWLPNYETAESKAQCSLRRFIDKTMIVSLELFEDYILNKAMPMYLQMHVEEPFIDALPRGGFNRYVHQWVNPSLEERRQFYLDCLMQLLNTKS